MASIKDNEGRTGDCTCPPNWIGRHHWSCKRVLDLGTFATTALPSRWYTARVRYPDYPVKPKEDKDDDS